MKSVFLIDDHPVIALGLNIALAGSTRLKLAGTAVTPARGLVELAASQPDCVVLDLVFAGSVEFPMISRARDLLPAAAIIVFSSLPNRLYAREATEAGADAYLNKEADISELIGLIEAFEHRPAPQQTSGAEEAGSRVLVVDGIHLTRRETQIALQVARGLSVAAIATTLSMSPHTVAAHRDNIRRKLHCRDAKELVARLARLRE